MPKSRIKAIAIDDEQHCLDTLVWELGRFCPEVEVIHCIKEEKEAKKIIPNAEVDLLFMDIHLQTCSGIELIRNMQPLDCHIIFITAYDQYAIEAFKVAAVDYLLKPVSGEKLKMALERYINRKNSIDQSNS